VWINKSCARLKNHTIPLVRFMGNVTEGEQKVREAIQEKNDGLTSPGPLRWLPNTCTIQERVQRGEINPSFVVIMVKGRLVAE
jgi:hypothetical protein